jgi:methylthioribose-1-phosphate isomerase
MLRVAREIDPDDPAPEVAAKLLAEAHATRGEHEIMCRRIGEHGAALLESGTRILTHCNAGGLATTGYGTIWELREAGIPLTLITDNMAGYFMGRRRAWRKRAARGSAKRISG